MQTIVFDIETSNIFPRLGERNVLDLDISIVGVYDSTDDSYTSYTQEELKNLWPRIEKTDALVGFNSDTFDIPLLNKYYPGDLTAIKSIDLLKDVQKGIGRRLRLNVLAEATLGEGKSADGLKAVEWWQQGEVDKVRKYCLQDVKVTKKLFDYALEHKTLKYKDLGELKEIKIDTSQWYVKDGGAMTHTLPL